MIGGSSICLPTGAFVDKGEVFREEDDFVETVFFVAVIVGLLARVLFCFVRVGKGGFFFSIDFGAEISTTSNSTSSYSVVCTVYAGVMTTGGLALTIGLVDVEGDVKNFRNAAFAFRLYKGCSRRGVDCTL